MAAGPDGPAARPAAGRARRLASGARSRVWELELPGAPSAVIKAGAPAAIAAEAAALAALAGTGLAPALLAAGDGLLATARLDGAGDPEALRDPAGAAAVGRLAARLHAREGADAAAYPGWDAPARSLDEYRRRRAAGGGLPDPPPAAPGARFVPVHGDLWSGNVVWTPAGPVLVDWDHHRMGDPAEELAYLAAMDDLDDAAVAALVRGHGGSGLAEAVGWWRPLLAAECADWYAAEGDRGRARELRAQAARLTARP